MSALELKIYNTLSRQKEIFKPMNPPEVKIYVCGPTVYDLLHIGNFRGPVFFNLVRNWMEESGFKVTFAMNFTDVDDKIINRAQQVSMPSQELAAKYIQEFKNDLDSLELKKADLSPTVIESMPEIIDFIKSLVAKDKAYEQSGDVLFSIKDFPEYGKLSGRKTDELLSTVRIEPNENKRNPLDFALWKKAKPDEPSWPSPWGAGRPGWHIECSAMACKHLGEQIDIHGGGLDLMFPHHENEIAQTEALTGKQLAKVWMHWNMLQLTGNKMSKSLGNIISLRDFLKINHPEVYKWMMLSVHYRSVLDFGDESTLRAVSGLGKVYSALVVAQMYLKDSTAQLTPDPIMQKVCDEHWDQVRKSLNDDFNTPDAFAAMYEVVRAFNTQVKRGQKTNAALISKSLSFRNFIRKFGSILSLFQQTPDQFLLTLDDRLLAKMNLQRPEIQKIVDERIQARQAKDFAKSDTLRAELTTMGIAVSDTADGSFWEVHK